MSTLLNEWKSAKKTFKKAATLVAKKKNPGLDLEGLQATLDELQKKSGLTPALKAVEAAEGKGPDAFETARKKYAAAVERYRGLLEKDVLKNAKKGGEFDGLKKALEELQEALDEIQRSIDARDQAAGSWQQADAAPKKRSALDKIGDALKGGLGEKEKAKRVQAIRARVDAIKLEGLYDKRALWKAFHQYNVDNFSGENSEFYQLYRQGAFASVQGKRDAYTTFLNPNAPQELNLPQSEKKILAGLDDITDPKKEAAFWQDLDLKKIASYVEGNLSEPFTRFQEHLKDRIRDEVEAAAPSERRAVLERWEKRIP